jgi:hypothetical protein
MCRGNVRPAREIAREAAIDSSGEVRDPGPRSRLLRGIRAFHEVANSHEKVSSPSSASTGQVRPGELETRQPEATPRTKVDPLTPSLCRLHLTVSAALLDKLKRANAGQSHVQPGASDEQVIDAALDLLLARQEKRKGSVPAKVKRAVRDRDGRCCQWPTRDGGVCGSTVRLEIDHVDLFAPRARESEVPFAPGWGALRGGQRTRIPALPRSDTSARARTSAASWPSRKLMVFDCALQTNRSTRRL